MPDDQQEPAETQKPLVPAPQLPVDAQPADPPPPARPADQAAPPADQVAQLAATVSQILHLPAAVSTLTPELILKLSTRLTNAQNKHANWIDPLMFNGSTILVLALTAGAAFIPSLGETTPKWIAPLCAGLAGVFVAMERALGFGARWRYHRDMYYGYAAIIDMLEFYPAIPPAEQSKYGRDIFSALYALRSRESAIPNAGTNTSPT